MENLKDVLWAWGKTKGLEGLEIYAFEEKGLKVEKKDRKLETFQPYLEKGVAIRLIKNHSLGFSFTTSFDPDDLVFTAERAYEMALSMPKDDYEFPEPQEYPGIEPTRKELISSEKALMLLEQMEEAAFSYDSRVKRIQEVGLSHRQGRLFMANSKGVEASWFYGGFSLVAVVVAMTGAEAQMGWEWRTALTPEEISPEEIAQNAAFRAVSRLGAKPLASQKVHILLPPHIAVEFLELISEALSGDNVLKGKSALAGKLGQSLFPSFVSIVDNGLLLGALGTRPFDDEGVAQRETYLVREGCLEGFLFDSYWGRKAGQGSTGNARRANFKNPPTVGLTNFYLEPGETPRERFFDKLPEVFEVLEVLGMHTADPISGEFSIGVSGLLHRKGEKIPVSGMALSGDVFSLFKGIEALGSDLTFYGNIGSPSILTGKLDLAGG
ncbi:TldD/PmbA family protein [Thermodesulfatator atlanticus]|uniref:TldD/PmbA family protein n=1 Tax=Thermodesulfatator atlanticus TaxID=501497 RepID=UPI0003B72936|nr:TldD/PmbA family protein [Thermodesulfatator atlanticus]